MVLAYVCLAVFSFLLLLEKTCKRKPKANKVIQITDEKCARCRSCVLKCYHQVLSMVNDKNEMRIEVKHPDQCTGCGKCINVCNFNALELISRK